MKKYILLLCVVFLFTCTACNIYSAPLTGIWATDDGSFIINMESNDVGLHYGEIKQKNRVSISVGCRLIGGRISVCKNNLLDLGGLEDTIIFEGEYLYRNGVLKITNKFGEKYYLKETDIVDCEASKKRLNEYVCNETRMPDENAKEYTLLELTQFFGKGPNDIIGFNGKELTFDDVNNVFPIEFMHKNQYSVYRVKQGGYFYVFWDAPISSPQPRVYFSAYISQPIDKSSFDSLLIGKDTAADVKNIDPSFELSPITDDGLYSYSLLNDDMIMRIKYSFLNTPSDYSDLIIEKKEVIVPGLADCRLSLLLNDNTGDGSASE